MSGWYASKLPAYSSASTTKCRPLPHRAVAGAPPVIADGSRAPTNALGSAPAAARTWTSQPDVVLLPCVPATRDQRAARRPRPRSTCCHDSTRDAGVAGRDEFGVVRVDRRQGLGDRQPVRGGDAVTCAASCAHSIAIPAASTASVYGDGPPGSQPVTIAPARCRQDAPRRSPRPRPTPTTWIRSPAGIGRAARAGASPGPDRGSRVTPPTRARGASSRAAAALSSWFAARSPVHR